MAATSRMPLPRQLGLLLAAMIAAGLLGLLLAAATSGRGAMIAATVAWAVAMTTGLAVLGFSALIPRASAADANAVLVSVLGAMAVRMALPLAAAVVVKLRFPILLEQGWLTYLIGFYLIALAVETWLALPSSGDAALAAQAQSKAT